MSAASPCVIPQMKRTMLHRSGGVLMMNLSGKIKVAIHFIVP